MVWPAGNHPGGSPTPEQATFRDAWQAGESIVYPITNYADGAAWEVRNYYGTLVATGTVSGPTITIPALSLGWYKLYVSSITTRATPWLNFGGERAFAVVRANASSPLIARPVMSTVETTAGGDIGADIPARGYFGMGAFRHKITDIVPLGSQHTYVANEIAYEIATRNADTARPLQPLTGCPNGYDNSPTAQTNLTSIVTSAVASGGIWFEGRNEPNVSMSYSAYAPEQNNFSARVHAAHASAKVMGPSMLAIGGDITNPGTSLGWFNAILPSIKAGLDGISFHNYDGEVPDLSCMRRNFDTFIAMLTTHGVQNLPRWNTEFGSTWAAAAGSMENAWQCKNTMFEVHFNEQYGITKEGSYLFYDLSHGFWGFPAFWMMKEGGLGQPTALVPLMRVWSEELWGKNYSSKFDFGAENDFYIGSKFVASDSSSVIVLQSNGHQANMTVSVSGTATIVTSDSWGNLTTRTVNKGTIAVPVDELPMYIRCPVGVTATPVALASAVDVLRRPFYSSVSATTQNALAPKAFNLDFTSTSGDWVGNTASLPATLQVDFPAGRMNRVAILCPAPHNVTCAITDGTVEAFNSILGAWVTVGNINETTFYKIWTSGNASGGNYVDSFYRRRSHWIFALSTPITATAVRLVINSTSFGGAGTNESYQGNPNQAGEIGQGGPQIPEVREIRVWLNEYASSRVGTPLFPAIV